MEYKNKVEYALNLVNKVAAIHKIENPQYLIKLATDKTFLERKGSIDLIIKIISFESAIAIEKASAIATNQLLLENNNYLEYIDLIGKLNDDIKVISISNMILNEEFIKREYSSDIVKDVSNMNSLEQTKVISRVATNPNVLEEANYLTFIKGLVNEDPSVCDEFDRNINLLGDLVIEPNFLKLEDKMEIFNKLLNRKYYFQTDYAIKLLKNEKVYGHKYFDRVFDVVLNAPEVSLGSILKDFALRFVDVEPYGYLQSINFLSRLTNVSKNTYGINQILDVLKTNSEWLFNRDDLTEILEVLFSFPFVLKENDYSNSFRDTINILFDFKRELLEDNKYENASIPHPLDLKLVDVLKLISETNIDTNYGKTATSLIITNPNLYECDNWFDILEESYKSPKKIFFTLDDYKSYSNFVMSQSRKINRLALQKQKEKLIDKRNKQKEERPKLLKRIFKK